MIHGRIHRPLLGLLVCAGTFLLWQNIKSPNRRSPVSTEDKGAATGEVHRQTAHRGVRAKRGEAQPVPSPTPEAMKVYSSVDLVPAWALRFGSEFWRRPSVNNDDNTGNANAGFVEHNAPFNVGDVIERVTHALEVDPAMVRRR